MGVMDEVTAGALAPGDSEGASVVGFDSVVVEVARDGCVAFAPRPSRPPPRVDGYLLASSFLDRPPPHSGECHPDGDELIWLISGAATVVVEAPGGDRRHLLRPGDAVIVARGLWHRIEVAQPSQIVNLTPGLSGDHRPIRPEDKEGGGEP